MLFKLRVLDEDDFDNIKSEWGKLQVESSANSLFMSWDWLHTWWKTWEVDLNRKNVVNLNIICIYQNDTLAGIVPLYKTNKLFMNLPYTEYQFLGNAWNTLPTLRSEYIGPIFHNSLNKELMSFFSSWTKNLPFNNVIVWPDSVTYNLDEFFFIYAHYKDYGIKINTQSSSFNEYLSSLGKNTRLKGNSRRKHLANDYTEYKWAEFKHTEENINVFFTKLNQFHLIRWEKCCFDKKVQNFYKKLILSDNEFTFELLYLEVENEIVSVLFNVITLSDIYNIQSGYSLSFNKKYSLGTMHLVHSIERAFINDNIFNFDLLAGSGLKESYKKHFKGKKVTFTTYKLFSSKVIVSMIICAVFIKRLFRF